jgi:hypothetical protein
MLPTHTETKHKQMRTKTLLLTAALSAAGIATSMAQVYSVNAVGYVNVPIAGNGFTMAANQFTASSYAISNVIPSAPLGSTVFVFVGGNYQTTDFNEFTSAWDNPNLQLPLGLGFFINNPQAATTLTMVGEVPQGTLNNPISSGFSIRSSIVPQAGTTGALGLVPGPGDVIFKFNSATQGYQQATFDEFGGTWIANSPGLVVDPVNGPSVAVGEAFFYNSVANTATWSRTFSVN